jgi:hypothetical protein
MTHHDLSTLLRQQVTRDEPAQPPDPWVSVLSGRRRLRVRRLVASGAALAVMAGAGVTGAMLLTDGDTPDGSRGIDPASARALADYDAQEMPRILDDHVRTVLERSVPDLGPETFRATDGQGAKLPPRLYDKASGMSVEYGPLDHRFTVDLVHSRGEAEGSATRYCRDGLAEGYYLECEVDTDADGNVIISQLTALTRPTLEASGDTTWMVARPEQLENPDPKLWFARGVKVIKSETLVTYVAEIVKAPTRSAAEEALQVPAEDLVEVGTDPVLVIPPPPTDDSGCGPWTLDPGDTYSC